MAYWPFGKKPLSFGEGGAEQYPSSLMLPLHTSRLFGLFYQIWKRLTVIKERSCEHALIL